MACLPHPIVGAVTSVEGVLLLLLLLRLSQCKREKLQPISYGRRHNVGMSEVFDCCSGAMNS